ncbi:hypothetical protein AB1K91_05095 [Terribacillus sp. 179-K 1B1 HS]|uniref:hypothetical protein n=1 Tax=Terribacillus sp. 179-K 1B1 HS TaxID=3142388 RepID=UPI0039A0D892
MDYQKLSEPKLIELDSVFGFVIATEISLDIAIGMISFRGKSYEYDDGNLQESEIKEINYSIKLESYFELDEKGNVID